MKTRFISDNIHGSISFSSLIEKPILADPLFNRLQGIKQNSTAYKTYPALEHSRFIHSLGVMHLSSQIFQHSILNSDLVTTKNFLGTFKDYILNIIDASKQILSSPSFMAFLFSKIGRRADEESIETIQNIINKSFLNRNIGELSKIFENDKVFSLFNVYNLEKENYVLYCILLQSLRICALFHDLGHPPYSHAVEFAVQDFYRKYKGKENKENEDSKKFFSTIQFYLGYINEKIGIKENKPFHESVTIIFIQNIFNNLIADLWENGVDKNDNEHVTYGLYFLLIRILTLSIDLGFPLTMDETGTPKKLDSSQGDIISLEKVFISLKNIISSDIDADRLDYVMRDAGNSGFSSYSFNISRILNNFTLHQDGSKFRFLTSIRSLNDTEKFLRERLSVYRYIVFHHNVVKTDLILYKILHYVFKLIILEENEIHIKHWKYFWEYLDTNNVQNFDLVGIEKFIMKASAWNEHWIMSAMNISYQFLHKKRVEEGKIEGTEAKLYMLLKEFLYNKRNLLSLWKRHSSFMYFANKFSSTYIDEQILFSQKIDELIDKLNKEEITSKLLSDFLKTKKDQINKSISIIGPDHKSGNVYEKANEKSRLVKFILTIIYELDKEIEENLESTISKALHKKFGVDFEVYFRNIENRLNSGVSKEDCFIGILRDHDPNEVTVEKLGHVSSVVDELEKATLFSPQFHLYIAEIRNYNLIKTNKISNSNIEEIYSIVIECILLEFKKLLSIIGC